MSESGYSQSTVDDFFEHSYNDRGMLKWQGFYLSDHTSALNKVKAEREKTTEYRPQQSLEEISQTLAKAYANNKTVEIQLNKLNKNDIIEPLIEKKIKGYNAENIIIENERFFSIESIRNIKIND
ncbi:hypothetical protein [Companilactobacillus musae]|uniref:hypothetical protein n=1 Tax=Companilactobacillus musae TaxID=1903258 RepID=UPI0034233A9F